MRQHYRNTTCSTRTGHACKTKKIFLCVSPHIQAHSSIIKTANIVGLGSNLRLIPTKRAEGYAMDAEALAAVMEEDRSQGLMPTFVAANVGSTSSCAIDPVRAVGEVCQRYGSTKAR